MPETTVVSAAPPIVPSSEVLDLPLQHRHDVRLLPASLVAETRAVEVVWSTGAEVRRTNPWNGKPHVERLSHEPDHVGLSRLANGVPLLDSHAAHRLAGITGGVERAWIEAGPYGPEGRAVIRFSSRAAVTPVWEDVRSFIIRHVFVGYRVRTFHIEEEPARRSRAPSTGGRSSCRWSPSRPSRVPACAATPLRNPAGGAAGPFHNARRPKP